MNVNADVKTRSGALYKVASKLIQFQQAAREYHNPNIRMEREFQAEFAKIQSGSGPLFPLTVDEIKMLEAKIVTGDNELTAKVKLGKNVLGMGFDHAIRSVTAANVFALAGAGITFLSRPLGTFVSLALGATALIAVVASFGDAVLYPVFFIPRDAQRRSELAQRLLKSGMRTPAPITGLLQPYGQTL